MVRHHYDVLVVGAGPAGALAARQVALRGASVLLVDKARFPRPKVCGCCINRQALSTLQQVGIKDVCGPLGANPINRLILASGGRTATVALPRGAALSRAAFDHALVEQATVRGVDFADRCCASLASLGHTWHRVGLRRSANGPQTRQIYCRVILVADGLGGRFLRDLDVFAASTRPGGRMGLAAVVAPAPQWLRGGTIYMACGAGGYVGFVRLEDGSFNAAAALDPAFLQAAGRPGPAVDAILHQAGWPRTEGVAEWRGTPTLTRQRRCLAADRIFVIGDAAGYVEPFTGEGIAWALRCGAAVADVAVAAVTRWQPQLADVWTNRYRRLVHRHQRVCRWVAAVLRRPRLCGAIVAQLDTKPWLAQPVVKKITAPVPTP